MDKSRLKWISQCGVWRNTYTVIFGAKLAEWMSVTRVTPTRRAWPSVLRTTSVSLLLFISFCNAFLSRRYVFESARGNLEIMTIFMRSDRILYQGQRRLKSRAWTQRKWWHLQFTHLCSLSCFRFKLFGLFSTMVRILLYILRLCLVLLLTMNFVITLSN